jgi:hypothetical protein
MRLTARGSARMAPGHRPTRMSLDTACYVCSTDNREPQAMFNTLRDVAAVLYVEQLRKDAAYLDDRTVSELIN